MLDNLRPGASRPTLPTASLGMNPTSSWPLLVRSHLTSWWAWQLLQGQGTWAVPTASRPHPLLRRPLAFPDIHSLQPQLDCGDKEIKVSLDRCRLEGLGFGEQVSAYLRDRNCSSIMQREERNWISVTSPTQANACGNILEVSGVHTVQPELGIRLLGPSQ